MSAAPPLARPAAPGLPSTVERSELRPEARRRPAWLIALAGLALFALALVPRLSLPPSLVTADEDTWVGLSGMFAAGLAEGRLERTYQIGHPGVTAFWASVAGMGVERARRYAGLVVYDDRVQTRRAAAREPTFLEDLTAARRGHAVVNALLVAGFGLLAWRLFGPGVGLLAGSLLALDPFMVAHAQVIRMDSLQAGFLGIGLLAALGRWAGGGGRAFLVLAGAAFGLALLSKTSSVLAAAPVLLLAGWRLRDDIRGGGAPGDSLRRVGLDLALTGGVALVAFAALFPALWVAPIATLARIVDYTLWNGGSPPESGNFFLGRAAPDPGPLFYPVALIFRLTPIVLGALLTLVLVAITRRRLLGGRGIVLLVLTAAVVVFFAALTPAPKKADRYLLPIWPLLILLAAVGLVALIRLVPRRGRLVGAALAAAIAAQAVWLPPISPYALTYFNPLVGGAPAARQAIMVGWGEGLEAVGEFLNAQPEASELVASTLYSEPLRPNFRGRSLPLSRYDEADYLVQYVNMEQRELLPPELAGFVAASPPGYTVDLAGVRFASVYRLPRPEFGGALRIEKYLLEDDAASMGERLEVALRWRAERPEAAGWRPRVELLGSNGRVMAGGEPPQQAAVGQTAATTLRLRLPDQRTSLTLGLSVVDEHGLPVRPTQVPPWARVEGERVVLPGVAVRVR